jgi:hypothetical protein
MWWELHRYEPGQPWFSPEYRQFLRDHPCVALSALRSEVPNGWVPDKDAYIAKYGDQFFTSSLAWMMAEAIERCIATGSPEQCKIGLWGVDMAANEEYEAQRSGCHFFSHIAQQHRIEVGVPPESDLFRPRFLYGFDENTHAFVKIRARRVELEQRLMAAEQMFEAKKQEMYFVKGALDDLNYCFNTWPDKSTRLGPPVIETSIEPGSQVAGTVRADRDAPGPKTKRRSRANGQGAAVPIIAETRLGPGHLV